MLFMVSARNDAHHRVPQDCITHFVSFENNVADCPRRAVFGRGLGDRVLQVGVKGLTHPGNDTDAARSERVHHHADNQLHAGV